MVEGRITLHPEEESGNFPPFIMKVFVILKLLSCKTYVFKEYILYVQNLNSRPVANASKEPWGHCQSCLPAWCTGIH